MPSRLTPELATLLQRSVTGSPIPEGRKEKDGTIVYNTHQDLLNFLAALRARQSMEWLFLRVLEELGKSSLEQAKEAYALWIRQEVRDFLADKGNLERMSFDAALYWVMQERPTNITTSIHHGIVSAENEKMYLALDISLSRVDQPLEIEINGEPLIVDLTLFDQDTTILIPLDVPVTSSVITVRLPGQDKATEHRPVPMLSKTPDETPDEKPEEKNKEKLAWSVISPESLKTCAIYSNPGSMSGSEKTGS